MIELKPILGFNGNKFLNNAISAFLLFYMFTGLITYFITEKSDLYHMSIFLSFIYLFFIRSLLIKEKY